jgi:hypothetical protein
MTACQFKSPFFNRTCPNPIAVPQFNLCACHLLSVGEKHPDHPVWRLSALLASEWPAKIREQFLKLVEETEDDPAIESHNFAGFWLPSVDLRGAQFTKPVFFNHAVFLHEAVFSESTFGESASFAHACFRGDADFMSMSFEREVDFEWARFRQDTLFSDAQFMDDALFCDAFIEGDLVFQGETFGGEADFRFAKIRKDGRLVFDGANLRFGRFGGLNLGRVDFRVVKWFQSTGNVWTTNRNALWDEFRPLEEHKTDRDLPEIADSYRQLVLNCEGRRDFESAEDFHIGEMEIRRRTEETRIRKPVLRWLWKHLNAYALYWQFSRYGTSYVVAIVWLLAWVVVLFPTVFMFSGFQFVDTTSGRSAGTIEYQILPDFRHTGQWFLDWLKAINFSVSIATFQKTRLFEPSGNATYLLSAIESVVVAAQSALVLFAIRRRFKR